MELEFTDEQKKFLDAEGKVILRACPGSGKTTVVAKKLTDYINNWDRPHQGVAVLTFTNVANEEIEKQAKKNHNRISINYPHFVGTLDSFINNFIVLRYGYRLLSANLRPKLLISNSLVPSYNYWKKDCYKCDISNFRWGIDDKLYYKKNIVNCSIKNAQYDNPCIEYKKIWFKKGVIFQNEAAGFAFKIIKNNPIIAEALAVRFPIIIVDEAQDTSEDQIAVLDLIKQAGVESIFLVGDPDQSIYEWRNASPDCFIKKINSNNWKVLELTANFRSSQLICNATRLFSKSLEGKHANRAMGNSSNNKQKPILLLYDVKTEDCRNKLNEKFLTICKDNHIEPNHKNVAIVTRGKVSNTISGLWKTKEVEFFAQASHEWVTGSRNKAYELCEKALFVLLIEELVEVKISIKDDISKIMPYEFWRSIVLEILVNLPRTSQILKDWVKQMQNILSQSIVDTNFKIRNDRKISDVIKIKTRDKNIPYFKELPTSDFFNTKNTPNYTYSSVHGVKGETYSALMLLVLGTKGHGTTLTPSSLNKESLDKEIMRLAYVAMTRPKNLLVVAMPNIQSTKNYPRFPQGIWQYMYL